MCGILGWFKTNEAVNKIAFRQMLESLEHRGPDDKGEYFNDSQNRALGHTRLSFLDLSEKGHQPMRDKKNSCIISFNGEIYNYLELKEELAANYVFKTDTDTEVILAAYIFWGLEFVDRLKGMFAIAILDERKDQLILIRDRFGIKPLYYYRGENDFVFASELKAIMLTPEIPQEINYHSFVNYFIYRYVPSPETIWQNVFKIPPANYAIVELSNYKIELFEYWKLESRKLKTTKPELESQINELLENSVKEHVRADVAIGSFLSGGYDSSALVVYMKRLLMNPKTFSIGFDKWEKSEHFFAEKVSNYLKVENEFIIVDENSLETINIMPQVYDEPIADISIIPTYMVSKLARTKVKAVLSGEGADEVFGGYTWQHEYYLKKHPDTISEKLKEFFNPLDLIDFYSEAMSMGKFDGDELKQMLHPNMHAYIPKDVNWFYRKNYKPNWSPLKAIQYLDIKCFMGELVLTKIDRASMANSLEVRVPFLDHKLFEKIFSLNEKLYYDKKQTKLLLFQSIKNDLPQEILKRKKQGFVGPDEYYMNKEWYRRELKDSLLISHKLINPQYVESLLNKSYDWRLWKIVVMEKWYRKWMS